MYGCLIKRVLPSMMPRLSLTHRQHLDGTGSPLRGLFSVGAASNTLKLHLTQSLEKKTSENLFGGRERGITGRGSGVNKTLYAGYLSKSGMKASKGRAGKSFCESLIELGSTGRIRGWDQQGALYVSKPTRFHAVPGN